MAYSGVSEARTLALAATPAPMSCGGIAVAALSRDDAPVVPDPGDGRRCSVEVNGDGVANSGRSPPPPLCRICGPGRRSGLAAPWSGVDDADGVACERSWESTRDCSASSVPSYPPLAPRLAAGVAVRALPPPSLPVSWLSLWRCGS